MSWFAHIVKRNTKRWPVVCFFNVVDISALNAVIIWILNPADWEKKKRFKWRLLLKLPEQARYSHEQCGVRSWLSDFRLLLNRSRGRVQTARRWAEKHNTVAAQCTCSLFIYSLFVCCSVHLWSGENKNKTHWLYHMLTLKPYSTVYFIVLWKIISRKQSSSIWT